MGRPILLDLFCGAGGAAAGYYSAGFEVIGVDHERQPRYPFEFICTDVFDFCANLENQGDWDKFKAVHASPPCQLFSNAGSIRGHEGHVNLIPQTRKAIQDLGIPYVIENVPGAPLVRPVLVCGLALGLGVKRHRLFESNVSLTAPPCPPGHPGEWFSVFGSSTRPRGTNVMDSHKHISIDIGRQAMGITWMNRRELSQAVPPAYTELLGKQLMSYVQESRSA